MVSNGNDLTKLTSCSLVVLGQIFLSLGNTQVSDVSLSCVWLLVAMTTAGLIFIHVHVVMLIIMVTLCENTITIILCWLPSNCFQCNWHQFV